jgi:hypothetical protein
VARKRDPQADARQRAAEVPFYAVEETAEALEAAFPFADDKLKTWLQAAVETLKDREQLSTVRETPRASKRRK